VEYSASLLVVDGQIRHVAVVRYVYADDAYVWPHVKEDVGARVSHTRLPKAHRDVFQRLLAGYSGVCNVNYKVVDEGDGGDGGDGDEDGRAQSLRIFEVNARVGSDLAVHARRELTKGFFEAAAVVLSLLFCEGFGRCFDRRVYPGAGRARHYVRGHADRQTASGHTAGDDRPRRISRQFAGRRRADTRDLPA